MVEFHHDFDLEFESLYIADFGLFNDFYCSLDTGSF